MKQIKYLSKTDIFSHWVNISYLPRWGVLLLDLLITLVSFTISKVIGTNLLQYDIFHSLLPIWGQVLVLIATQTLFFWAFHTYSGILRFSTFVDIIKVALSVLSTGVLLIGINLIIRYSTIYTSTPYLTTTLLIYVFVAICLLVSWRITIKTVFEYLSQHNKAIKKVFI